MQLLQQLAGELLESPDYKKCQNREARLRCLPDDLRSGLMVTLEPDNNEESVIDDALMTRMRCHVAALIANLPEHTVFLDALEKRIASVSATLEFRAWQDTDLPLYTAFLEDQELWHYMPEKPPENITPEIAASLITMSNKLLDRHLVRAVVMDSEPVGQVRLEFSSESDSAEISYWLGSEHRGRGIAVAAIAQFGSQALQQHSQLHRIIAKVHPENIASRFILEKSGYAFEFVDYSMGAARLVYTLYRPVLVSA